MIVALGVAAVLGCAIPLFVSPRSPFRLWIAALVPLVITSGFLIAYAVTAHSTIEDKLVYVIDLDLVSRVPFADAAETVRIDGSWGYSSFMWLLGHLGVEGNALFGWVGLLSALAITAGSRLILPTWKLPGILLIAVSLGFTASYASIVIRQSLAMSLIFVAVCLILRGCRLLWAVPLALAPLFHWSSLPIVIVVALLALVRLPLRVALIAWGAAAIAFVTHLQEKMLSPILPFVPKFDVYSGSSAAEAYGGGTNRLDFLALSGFFLVAGLFFHRRAGTPAWYSRLLTIYTLLNVYFLLFGFISFSDRIAAYSWSLAPLLLAAPLGWQDSVRSRVTTLGVMTAVVAVGIVLGPYPDLLRLALS